MSGSLLKHPFPITSTTRVNLNYDLSIEPGFPLELLPSEEGCENFRNRQYNVDGTEDDTDGPLEYLFFFVV
jgi:hypothetical protein